MAAATLKTFGTLSDEQARPFMAAMGHSATLYAALCDRQSLWDPATIDAIMADFPKGHIEDADLFLVLAECIANAVLHGQAEMLSVHARHRGPVLLVSFMQAPPMQKRVRSILDFALQGRMQECAVDLPGGLGLPILLKLARRITISPDDRKLQLWFTVRQSA